MCLLGNVIFWLNMSINGKLYLSKVMYSVGIQRIVVFIILQKTVSCYGWNKEFSLEF